MKYYTIFIIKIGILQLCSKESEISIVRQKIEIERFYKQYLELNINRDYDWYSIHDSDKKWLKNFMCGKIDLMLFELYKQKIIDKARILYAK